MYVHVYSLLRASLLCWGAICHLAPSKVAGQSTEEEGSYQHAVCRLQLSAGAVCLLPLYARWWWPVAVAVQVRAPPPPGAPLHTAHTATCVPC